MSRILFVHEGYISQKSSRYYSNHYDNTLVERYKQIADEVVFLTREDKANDIEKLQNEICVDGFRFVGVDNFKSMHGMFKLREISDIIASQVKLDDYIVARLSGEMGALAVKYARILNKRYVVEVVGCAWDAMWNHSLFGKLVAPYSYTHTKLIVRNAPFVIYVTQEFLQNRYPTKGRSIGCSDVDIVVNRTALVNRLEKIENMREYSGCIQLGTLAVVDVKYKGQEYVIKAIAALKDCGLKFKYKLAGAGDNSYLKRVAKEYDVLDNVEFCGMIPKAKVVDFISTLDLYIQPSMTEGLPRSLIEAMGVACPCFGSRVGGIPELLGERMLFSRGSVREIADKLRNINQELLKENALLNYEKSKKYESAALAKERIEFLRFSLGKV